MKNFVNFAPKGGLIELRRTALVSRKQEHFTVERDADYQFRVNAGELKFNSLSTNVRVRASAKGFVDKKTGVLLGISSEDNQRQIKGFSIRSRSRLNRKIAMLDKSYMPLFVTLTYGKSHPELDDVKEYKRHLDNFFKMLDKRFSHVVYDDDGGIHRVREYGAIWKAERQKRGVMHFHLLLWGVSMAKRHQIVKIWYKIAGYGDILVKKWHMGLLGNGNKHCVQPVRSWHGVVSYASKYLAKLDERVALSGRIWGVRGVVPFSPVLRFEVSDEVASEFRYWMELEVNKNKPVFSHFAHFGFWCGNYDVKWLLFLECLCNQPVEPDYPLEGKDYPDYLM